MVDSHTEIREIASIKEYSEQDIYLLAKDLLLRHQRQVLQVEVREYPENAVVGAKIVDDVPEQHLVAADIRLAQENQGEDPHSSPSLADYDEQFVNIQFEDDVQLHELSIDQVRNNTTGIVTCTVRLKGDNFIKIGYEISPSGEVRSDLSKSGIDDKVDSIWQSSGGSIDPGISSLYYPASKGDMQKIGLALKKAQNGKVNPEAMESAANSFKNEQTASRIVTIKNAPTIITAK